MSSGRRPSDDCASVVSPTPEQDLDLARQAIAKGETRHAAHHLAGVVALDPKRPGLADAIAEWMKLSDDPLEQVPMTSGVYYGAAALRAMVLQRLGDGASAVQLLLDSLAAKPDAPFVDLVDEWLTPTVAAAVPPVTVTASTMRCLEHAHLRAGLLPLLERLHRAQPAEGRIAWLLSRAMRLSGKTKEALAFITDSHAAHPSYFTAVAVAAARKQMGDLEGAIGPNQEALRFQPEDIGVRLDLGDTYLDLGRLDEASSAYAAVLEREPDHPWAKPSALYIEARRGSTDALADLESLARAAQPGSRALALFDRAAPYLLSIRPPDSSILNAVADAIQRQLTPKNCAVSSLEAPSVIASVHDASPELAIEFAEVPSPDPRKPRRRLPHRAVWTYEAAGLAGKLGKLDTHARPGVPPPADDVTRSVAAIASCTFERSAWGQAGRALGARLGHDAGPAILGAMVHPGPRPDGVAPWAWRFRVQVAAALALLGIDRGWTNSARQRALFTLLYGPVDCSTTAALIAITELACTVPEQREALAELMLAELVEPVNPVRYACVVEPLLGLLPQVPLEDGQRDRFLSARRRLGG